jgi:hypothetical protein
MKLRYLHYTLAATFCCATSPLTTLQAAEQKEAPQSTITLPTSPASQLRMAVEFDFPPNVIKGFFNGAININALDDHGKTALDYAKKESKTYALLIQHGAKTSQEVAAQQAQNQQEAAKEQAPINQNLADPIPLLKQYYQQHDQLPKLLDDPVQKIDDCYIRLALTTQVAYKKQHQKAAEEEEKQPEDSHAKHPKKQHEKEDWHQSLDYQQLHQVTKPIQLEKIWEKQLDTNEKEQVISKEPPRQITITGEAGSGKTTLVQRITHSWSSDKLWKGKFDWLLTLPLRQLQKLKSKEPYPQIIEAANIPSLTPKQLEHLFTKKAKKGLLILDGYDEVEALHTKEPNSPFSTWFSATLANPDLHLILTSRPTQGAALLTKARALHVVGFQQDDIEKYVTAYFDHAKQSAHAPSLLHTLKQQPHLQLLSRTPIYLRLFCLLARSQGPTSLDKKSLGELYQDLIDQYLRHSWEKETGKSFSPKAARKASAMELSYLGHLAWHGMEKGRQILSAVTQQSSMEAIDSIFPTTDPSAPTHLSRIRRIGLLQNIGRGNSEPTEETYFPHLTFQEWFAAHHLAHTLYAQGKKAFTVTQQILRDDKYSPRYQVMLPFLAAILYNKAKSDDDPEGKALLLFWELLESQPRELSGIHHALLVMR